MPFIIVHEASEGEVVAVNQDAIQRFGALEVTIGEPEGDFPKTPEGLQAFWDAKAKLPKHTITRLAFREEGYMDVTETPYEVCGLIARNSMPEDGDNSLELRHHRATER